MKRISLLTIFAVAFAAILFSTAQKAEMAPVKSSSTFSSSFKILNDTSDSIQVHTGSGIVNLNKGGSTSVSCNEGREIRTADKGKKGGLIFTVDSSMCGKTVKLSKYL